jgi:hypothetical protein
MPSPLLIRSCRWLVYPPVAWALFVGEPWAWHTPALYEHALTSEVSMTYSTPAFSPRPLPSGGQWCNHGRVDH